jgi:hypothetical protein
MRRGQAGLYIRAGAETGIEQALCPQTIQRRVIAVQPLRLENDFAIPFHAQPAQVGQYPRDMFGPIPCAVYILDPQAKGAARRARHVHGHQRRPAMADMQQSGGAGGKAGHHMLWCGKMSHTGS